MATIYDVAELAGVSTATVSRVITNQGPMRENTRAKVLEAMKLLNYIPSIHAQGIRTGKSKTIGVFVPDHSNTFYNTMFMGIEEEAIKRDYLVMICNTNKDPQREIHYAKMLLQHNIDGFIYNTYIMNKASLDFFFSLAKEKPVVFMDNIVPPGSDYAYVMVDGKSSTKKAVSYLYELGCRRIAYIRLPSNISVVGARYEGYVDGIRECGLPFDETLVYNCSKKELGLSHIQIGSNGARELVKMKNPPDAIVSASDALAIGALTYLKRNGWAIPEDIKVVGYDNIEMSSIILPNLTTIAQPAMELGRRAARILIDSIEGKSVDTKQVHLEAELLIREST